MEKGAIMLTKNAKHNAHMKHINIGHHYIWEWVDNGDIVMDHITLAGNLADIFTKKLGKVMHNHICVLLCLCEGYVIKPGGVLKVTCTQTCLPRLAYACTSSISYCFCYSYFTTDISNLWTPIGCNMGTHMGEFGTYHTHTCATNTHF
jgi:hypothetical protein